MRVGRHLLTLVVGLAAGLGALLMLALLDQPVPVKQKAKTVSAVSMQVKRTKPKKRKPKPKQRKRKTKPKRSLKAPPPMSSDLSDVSLSGGMDWGLENSGDDWLSQRSTKDLVMSEGSVDAPPRPSERVAPEYPEEAHALGTEGKVTLSLLISKTGSVERVRVVKANPKGIFEDAAKAAVQQWRFEPGRYQGDPVRVWARQVINFKVM